MTASRVDYNLEGPAPEAESVLHTAIRLTQGDRGRDYGTPKDNWGRTATIASALVGKPLTAEECVKVAMAMKYARLIQTPNHLDSIVDLAGYAWVLSEVMR